jgi:hypothetical protein
MSKGWKLALALACLGAVLSLTNAVLIYQRTGQIAYGKIALAFGVPALFYAIARSAQSAGRG